jgi:8-oxo-dGTP diphosphatase
MKFEFSAGGIVYKKEEGKTFILLGQHSGHKGWVFPKGLIGDHKKREGKEETAVREVKEETGVEAEIEKQITPVKYWYVWEGEKRKKTVYYFLMKETGGNINDHDWEMSDVKWVGVEEVEKTLTYPSNVLKLRARKVGRAVHGAGFENQ